jgi:hypothetical protein
MVGGDNVLIRIDVWGIMIGFYVGFNFGMFRDHLGFNFVEKLMNLQHAGAFNLM